VDWHAPGLIAPANPTPDPRFVTDVIVELGLAAPDDVHAAVEAARTSGGRPETMLVRTGALDDHRLAVALAERYGLPRLELDHFPVDGEAARLVDVGSALRHEALPVAHLDDGRLLVAIADPAGGPAASAVAAATGRQVVAAVAPRGRLRALIEAAASRAPLAPAPPPAPVVEADAPAAAPPLEHVPPPADHDDRIAGLERALEDARARAAEAERRREEAEHRAAGADERASAAMQRILELETELQAAHATLAAVRDAVGVAR
jgi:Type II secretion system (T2SS), protein E, N-terminal domain